MRNHRYTRHAARFFLAAVVLLGLPVFIGNILHPARGLAYGVLVGILLLASYFGGRAWRYRRGLAWVEVAKQSGLRPVHQRDTNLVPLPRFQLLGNLVGGNVDGVRVLIGDRMEQYLLDHAPDTIGTIDLHQSQVSDPIAEETFVAVWIPGLAEDRWNLGKRLGMFASNLSPEPSNACIGPLRNWLHAHPGWRLEGVDDLIVAFRPNGVAPTADVGKWVEIARSLGSLLNPSIPSTEASSGA